MAIRDPSLVRSQASGSPSPREDQNRIEVCVALQTALLSGYLARGVDLDSASHSAQRYTQECIRAASHLCAANADVPISGVPIAAAGDQDVSAQRASLLELSQQRLRMATTFYASALTASIAQGSHPDPKASLLSIASHRDTVLRTCQAMLSHHQDHATGASPHADSPRDVPRTAAMALTELSAKFQSAVMAGYMANGRPMDEAVRESGRLSQPCYAAATRLYETNATTPLSTAGSDRPAQRLSMAADLYASTVFGSIARADPPREAIASADRRLIQIVATADRAVLDAVTKNSVTKSREDRDRSDREVSSTPASATKTFSDKLFASRAPSDSNTATATPAHPQGPRIGPR